MHKGILRTALRILKVRHPLSARWQMQRSEQVPLQAGIERRPLPDWTSPAIHVQETLQAWDLQARSHLHLRRRMVREAVQQTREEETKWFETTQTVIPGKTLNPNSLCELPKPTPNLPV